MKTIQRYNLKQCLEQVQQIRLVLILQGTKKPKPNKKFDLGYDWWDGGDSNLSATMIFKYNF